MLKRSLLIFVLAAIPACAEAWHPTALVSEARPGTAAAPDPSAARAQLADLLTRLTAAVGAADQQSYLACVSLTDSCFATEQRNWAKDLGRKAPEQFEASLLDGDPVINRDGTADAKMRMAWHMSGGRDRSLTYTARFVRSETGWLYAGEKWNEVGSDHVRILFDDGLEDVAKNVAAVLPEVRAHVHEGFGLEADRDLTERVQEVKLYRSMKHLQQSIYLSYSDSLAGWNEPGESIKILATEGSGKGSLRVLLAHEYGHVATFQLGPKASDMPWWLLEGVAELSAQEFSRDWSRVSTTVRGWAAADKLVDWDKLADFHGEATQHMIHVYVQGHHMLGYVSERFGRAKRNDWMRDMAQGASLDDATRNVLGLSFAELDRDWRKSLQSNESASPDHNDDEHR